MRALAALWLCSLESKLPLHCPLAAVLFYDLGLWHHQAKKTFRYATLKNKAAPCKATSETKLEMKNENKGTIDEGFMLCAEITEMSNKMT